MGDTRNSLFSMDSASEMGRRSKSLNLGGNQTNMPKSTLFFKGRRTDSFYTEDSGLYITPREQALEELGYQFDKNTNNCDSVSSRIIVGYRKVRSSENDLLYRMLKERYDKMKENLSLNPKQLIGQFSVIRLWNASIVGAILLGMLSMTFIYRSLGQEASADDIVGTINTGYDEANVEYLADATLKKPSQVLGLQDKKDDFDYIASVIQELEVAKKNEWEEKIREMVEGYPIEKMVPYIAEQDKIVAAFLISIAKKESNWGKRVPVLKGQDCYNYWGYRGQRKLMGTGGHTCFNSRKDAVDTVAKRIDWLVNNKKLNTPDKMIIWKCGSSCATHSQESVRKWISDVNLYFKKLNS